MAAYFYQPVTSPSRIPDQNVPLVRADRHAPVFHCRYGLHRFKVPTEWHTDRLFW